MEHARERKREEETGGDAKPDDGSMAGGARYGKRKKKNSLIYIEISTSYGLFADLVPRAGVEPARSCEQRILSPLCLPFHHQGTGSRLVFERALSGKDHRDAGFVAAIDDVPIAQCASWLNDGGYAFANTDLETIPKGEEGV